MKYVFVLVTVALLACGEALAQDRPPNEANCRKAIEEYSQTIAKTPAGDAKDRKRKEEVEAKMRAAVTEGRAKKLSECEIWGKVMGIAFAH